jgi:outer membrane protein insertion porin family
MAKLRTDTDACRHIQPCWLRPFALLVAIAAFSTAVAQQVAPEPPGMATPLAGAAGPTPAESLAAATPADKVVDVKIRGNKSLPFDKILPHIRTRPGRPFDLELIEEDVRRLDRTHMFVNVKTYWQQVDGGRIVIFDVLERPLLSEVLFVGCSEIRRKTLAKESELKKGDPVDPFAIEEARRKLEEFYHKRGFTGARIVLLEGDKAEDRRAVFLINEGTKQRVWKTDFVGNTIASDDRLKTQIKSKPPFLYLFKGELDRKEVDEDLDRLTAYYRGLGFFRARIGRELAFNEKENWVTVTFVIDEGPRYKVRNVSVLGNTKYTSDVLMADLKLKDGEYFNQAKMTADQTSLQDKYGGIGYVFTDVKADPRFLEEPGQLDLVYSITEGDRFRVGKINVDIKGEYPHTQITTILNRLSIKPGDIVDIREIRASERRIRASGLFEANPASGNAPKIVFNPPDQDPDQQQVAEKPSKPARKPGSKFRGQSPDSASGDRELDLTLDCGRYVGPQANEERKTKNEQRSVQQSSSDDLSQMAREFGSALSQQRPKQSPSRLILTQQYSPNAGQVNPASQGGRLQWTSAAGNSASAPMPPATSTAAGPSASQSGPTLVQSSPAASAPTQTAPVQPAPAYGQQIWPGQAGAPERPINSPEGPYVPGPIFGESSPFRDGPPDGGGEPARNLDFNVKAEETMTGRLMFGVGINSDAGLVGSVVLDEQNFDWTRFPNSWEDIRNATAWRGAGQRFRIEAVPGTQVQRYMVNFQEPYMFNTAVSMGLSGYYYNRIYTEYTEQRLGGRVALGYQLTPDLSGNIAYRGAKINITNPIDPFLPALAEVTGRDLALHGFQLSLTHDKRDNAFLATEGHLIEASVEQVLGSFQYPRAELDVRKYFTLFERPDGSGRQVLSLAARAGYTGDNTPIYDRFYAGGFSTIRGFQFRGASPREIGPSTGADIVVGGDFQVLASAEYLFPITADDMLRGVVFCDTGTVEPRLNDWNNKYRVAPGFGLRIVVPAMGPAPIALDFAFPVSWQPGDRHEMFSFFMGFGR